MHLKLGKSFPSIKFRPPVTTPLRISSSESKSEFSRDSPILTFQHFIDLDVYIGTSIAKIKQQISAYINAVKTINLESIANSRNQLKLLLEEFVKLVSKLDMQSVELDLTELFIGNRGLYSLYRYAWTPDILHLLNKIKDTYDVKNCKNSAEMIACMKSAQSLCQIYQDVFYKQAKLILSQFAKQLYIIPDNWFRKLIKSSNIDQCTKDLINEQPSQPKILSKLLTLYSAQSAHQHQQSTFRSLITALLYTDIEQQFCAYLSYLVGILYSRPAENYHGEVGLWRSVYMTSLKVYARRQDKRDKNGVSIDQLLLQKQQDPQFTQFLLNLQDLASVSLSSVGFYYKNCPQSTQLTIKPFIMKKINQLFTDNVYEQYQQIVDYYEQALPEEKNQIVNGLQKSINCLIQSDSIQDKVYVNATQYLLSFLRFVVVNTKIFFKIFSQQTLNKIVKVLTKQTNSSNETCPSNKILFLYELINTTLMHCYQEEFDLDTEITKQFEKEVCSQKRQSMTNIYQQILIQFRTKFGLQIHESGVCLVHEWNLSNKKLDRKKKKKQMKQNQQNLSESSGDEQQLQQSQDQQQEVSAQQRQICRQVSELILFSARIYDYKFEKFFLSNRKRSIIAQQTTKLFKVLYDCLSQQRTQIQKYLSNQSKTQQFNTETVQSFLLIKGIKDKLIHDNCMNLTLRLPPNIPFAELTTFAVQFLTFTAPITIDEPMNQNDINYASFDPCDFVSGEQPIESMKLIYKKIIDFTEDNFNFQCLRKLPMQLIKNLCNCDNNKTELVKSITSVNSGDKLNMRLIEQFEQIKKFLFYCELMSKIFNKLNEKSQKGIKQVRIIYASLQRVCFRIWEIVADRVISAEIYALCQSNTNFQSRIKQIQGYTTQQLKGQSLQFYQTHFNCLIKSIKLPYIDSILSNTNYITKTCQQVICGIGKVLNPTNFLIQYQKLFNPLHLTKIDTLQKSNKSSDKIDEQSNDRYLFIGQIVQFLAMIQYTCCNQQSTEVKSKEEIREWQAKWRKNCKQLSVSLLEQINKRSQQLQYKTCDKNEKSIKNLEINVFLVHLKAQIIKILIPFLINDPLKNPNENPKSYNTQLQQTFSIFSVLSQIVQKISPGEEDHLMTFLELFESFESKESKNIQASSKISEFLYRAIESLLELAFLGIRVRSYHFYKFIRSYLRLTKQKQNYLFFNSVTCFYIQKLLKQILPAYSLSQSLMQYCDDNIKKSSQTLTNKQNSSPSIRQSNNSSLRQSLGSNRENLINQGNLKKSVNKIRFSRFIKFENNKNQCSADKICLISMFINLFSRLNFKNLTQGIEKIWQSKQMHLVYVSYLQTITSTVSKQITKTDKKSLDIINVDCFGNLAIIMKHPLSSSKTQTQNKKKITIDQEYNHKMLYELLVLIELIVKTNFNQHVKDALNIPVKKILSEIKNTSTPICTIDFLTSSIQQLNLSLDIPSSSPSSIITPIIDNQQSQPIISTTTSTPCTQILDMILTCYNIKLVRAIKSNVHFSNLLFVCWDSQMKERVMENNMVYLDRRMGRKEIRQNINQWAKNSSNNGKKKKEMNKAHNKGRRSSITGNKDKQEQNNVVRQFPTQCWSSISKHSQQLIHKIISNFIQSYTSIFITKTSQKSQPQQTPSSSYSILFNNLKILSLITLNNPELLPYLQQHKHKQMTVLDIMMHAATHCFVVFVEIYGLIIKTNCGFQNIVWHQQKSVVPHNFIIQNSVKYQLINKLKIMLSPTHSTAQNDDNVSQLIKTLQFISKLSSSSNKPYFRSYKFGSVINYSYQQMRAEHQLAFWSQLSNILKQGIQNMGSNHNNTNIGDCVVLLNLYEQVLNKILKSNDIAWMKLNLDIKLNNNQIEQQNKSIQQPPLPVSQLSQALNKAIPIRLKVSHVSSEQCHEITCTTYLHYNFQPQVLDQQIYSIVHQLQNTTIYNSSKIGSNILRYMSQYASKHTVWEDLCDNQGVLLYNRSSYNNSVYGSNIISSEQPSVQLNNNNSNNSSNSNDVDNQYSANISSQQDQQTTNAKIQGNSIVQQQEDDQVIADDGIIEDDQIQQSGNNNNNSNNNNCDGIIEDDCYDEQQDNILQQGMFVDQIKQCMSETSLQFLSQHQLKYMPACEQQPIMCNTNANSNEQATKQQLLHLYQQSSINPQAHKLLLSAITQANVIELQKFIAHQAVDQQIQIIVVRELWTRGVLPSQTSISRSSRYWTNLGKGIAGRTCANLYINQAVLYKKMYQQYNKSKQNPTQAHIAKLNKSTLQYILILSYISVNNTNKAQTSTLSVWKLMSKLAMRPSNMRSLLQICLQLLGLPDLQLENRVNSIANVNGIKSDQQVQQPRVCAKSVKLMIANDILQGCIRDKMGLSIILTHYWDCQQNNIVIKDQSKQQIQFSVPILEYILKQSYLISQALVTSSSPSSPSCIFNNSLIRSLWKYFRDCTQFKAHSKLQSGNNNEYPYYQVQESISISDQIITKIVQLIFNNKCVIGVNKKQSQKDKDSNTSRIQELFMILVYLDPMCFQSYFTIVIQKISEKLSSIVKKQQKILTGFQSNWASIKNNTTSPGIDMQKQQKYWNWRQSKKSTTSTTDQTQQTLEYFRNILVDISVNLLPKFKKIRFNYHCGKMYRDWKLQIQILKQKLLTCGSVEGLVQLENKQKQLEDWRRNQSNQIINQQILPIIQDHSQEFLKVLSQAQEFVKDFLNTFQPSQQNEKLIIYSSCSKIYEILLAAEIMTHEQKLTYHSMSKLKTVQTLESSKNVYGHGKSLGRKSNLINRKSARLSINSSCAPKVSSLLKKIGPSCTYLSTYIGSQEPIRQLHAKYSDINKRLGTLWANQTQNDPHEKPQKQKIIQCRRTHILEDTLAEIDDDFINLPVKIKFQGQIGIDYGGVTRQWITLFMKEIIKPELGLFSLSANKLTFQPNKNSHLIPNHLRYFRKIGILVGKAMKQNWLLQVNLTKSFLKHLLGATLYIQDLEDIDPQTAKSLKWILQNDIGFDDCLGLNFTYECDKLGKKSVIQLIPDGINTPVNEDNKKKYVKMIANIKMTEQIREQSKTFMAGLESVIPYSTLSLFSYKEISLYLSGMPTINVKQMQEHARYQVFTPQSQQIVWFWSIISEWSQQQLANLLFFLTGSYKVPYGGFKQHAIGFNKLANNCDYLPVAHTCFNMIDLSSYTSKQKMQRLLKKSIKQGKGFSVS